MTRVEELRLKLRISSRVSGVWADIDSLITVAHAEGVAEGAERERERIRGESQMVGVDEDCIKFIGTVDNYVGAAFLVPVDVMDPPVLAPTKEVVLQKQMEEQAMEDQEKEDMLTEDMKRHQQQDDRERWARENP